MTLPVNDDFADLLACLNEAGVDFLVVGAHALAAHGHVRATGDLDVLVRADAANAERVMAALDAFGAPTEQHGVGASDFARPGMVYQIGLPPRRIGILTQVSGVDFAHATVGVVEGTLAGSRVRFPSIDTLIQNKRASGRLKDLADVEVLERLAENRDAAFGSKGD